MDMKMILEELSGSGNLRTLPEAGHSGKYIFRDGRRMLNLSSNDYLGIASDGVMMDEFLHDAVSVSDNPAWLLSSSSSRLLTGNHPVCTKVEETLASMFGAEAALTFSSGYHMNTGILPAVSDTGTLILADKLVHASLIDGMRLASARTLRYRHQDLGQLEQLVTRYCNEYSRIIIVTESIFSMDGDVTDLRRLVEIKKSVPSVMLYVDEAHAFGARGGNGLGVAEEQGCVHDIDFLCGTFGKALASMGAYLICSDTVRKFLVNRMRTLIFTTALPPLNYLWTLKMLEMLPSLAERRRTLEENSAKVRNAVSALGQECPSDSHIIPFMVGDSNDAIRIAKKMQDAGFYLLPVRPPTVPAGTSRLRISMTAAITGEETDAIVDALCGIAQEAGITQAAQAEECRRHKPLAKREQ
ncbi:MAG: 8-amino-7-oxononanoate synthase [Bacteroides sp.]|nr:8-amino-7-oxononanoate synthase [Bacteroides sp.]